ncbi:hypothetical protein AgCh_004625 [Apium graveolens]
MKEVTFKNVKYKTGGLIPRKGDAREYRRNDSRITLEVLQGERKGQRGGRHFKVSRYRLIRSLREDNVDLHYDRMKLESARCSDQQWSKGPRI